MIARRLIVLPLLKVLLLDKMRIHVVVRVLRALRAELREDQAIAPNMQGRALHSLAKIFQPCLHLQRASFELDDLWCQS